jgi:hypothetical protein
MSPGVEAVCDALARVELATIEMTHRKHPRVAVTIGARYIEEFYRTPEPFGSGHPPQGVVLKRLVLLFDPALYEEEEDLTPAQKVTAHRPQHVKTQRIHEHPILPDSRSAESARRAKANSCPS